MGRFKELEANDLPSSWTIQTGVDETPKMTCDLDWLLRLSETNTLIKRYQRVPYTVDDGKKAIFRFSIVLKSVVPLQAFVVRESHVRVLYAKDSFTMDRSRRQDPRVHLCTEVSDLIKFTDVPRVSELYAQSLDMIRDALKAL
jgi:hypothetical protein